MPCRCLNCPSRPEFATHVEFTEHWKLTHTVPTTHTVLEMIPNLPSIVLALAPDLAKKKVVLHEEFEA
jgi:hypothetical protein